MAVRTGRIVRAASPLLKGIIRNGLEVPVAPHVATSLRESLGHDYRATGEVASLLTSSQLRGHAILSDPLPRFPNPPLIAEIESLKPAERRVLLIAALSVTDQVSILLGAAAVDIDTVLNGPLLHLLQIENGRFGLGIPGFRSAVKQSAEPGETHQAHGALAAALRRRGYPGLAAWHALSATNPSPDTKDSQLLLRLAQVQLERGAAAAAQRIASMTGVSSSGPIRGHSLAVAARAALLAGNVDDADRLLTAASEILPRLSGGDLRSAIDIHREGPEGDPSTSQRWTSLVLTLQRVVTAPGDRTAFAAMAAGTRYSSAAADEADSLMARTVLAASRSLPGWALVPRPEAMTPLGETFVRLMEAAFQIQAGNFNAAHTTLSEAVPRLPLATPGGGVVSLLRLLAKQHIPVDESLITVYEAIGPPNRVDPVLDQNLTGSRTSVASRTRFSGPDRTNRPVAPGRNLPLISSREQDVLTLVIEGMSNGGIGQRLGISTRTVEVHLGSIYRKTGASSRHQLIAEAFKI
ncbi:helix-turn-helix transcriptional regulator [Paenarthrobacter nicotinovorans]|uniref:Helix-turn-helix transcriptional regulator n=1 Tax=Paenarthrobacter nicotinovorans TaxID=29320 RepID=A0ABV0GLS7_PAENI